MNCYEINNFLDIKRHILAFSIGIVAYFIPNDKSNSNPLLNGAIFSGLFVKFLYGDYDKGYQYTFSDIIFWIVVLFEGFMGAYFMKKLDNK